MRLALMTTVAALALAAPAHAQLGSVRNGSEASKQVFIAAGAIGESGVKAASGVVAIPLGGVAVASGSVAHGANASGYTEIGDAFADGAEGATGTAKAFVDFSGKPLTITNDVILDRQTAARAKANEAKPKQGAPTAQPAPSVPYAAEQH